MRRFFSAWGTKSGDIRWHWALDSHADIAQHFGIKDDDQFIRHAAKFELVPTSNWLDPESWEFVVDEPTRPEWLTEEIVAAIRRRMVAAAKSMIVGDCEKRLIVDGAWIIGGYAAVYDVRGGRILRVRASRFYRSNT